MTVCNFFLELYMFVNKLRLLRFGMKEFKILELAFGHS